MALLETVIWKVSPGVQRTIAGRSACYSTAWETTQRTCSHPHTFPVHIRVNMQRLRPSLTPFPKYGRTWFLNVRGLTDATKWVTPQSNLSPVLTAWRTTVPTLIWRTICIWKGHFSSQCVFKSVAYVRSTEKPTGITMTLLYSTPSV